MARRGRKRTDGPREPSGRPSRRNAAVHERATDPYHGWNIYFATTAGMTKVGYSGNVKKRMTELRLAQNSEVRLLGTIQQPDRAACCALEGELHRRLITKGFHISGEWFDMSDIEVVRELEALVADGYVVCGINKQALERFRKHVHFHTDAAGVKFAGVASRI